MTWKLVAYLKDYCSNCTLAGFAYMANHNLHPMERFFWLLCVLFAAFGSYHLISQYEQDFQAKAVSIVYESLPPHSAIKFPSVSICDYRYDYEISDEVLDYIQSLGSGLDGEYNEDVESHVAFILYPYLYYQGIIKARCKPYVNCTECAKCPTDDYRAFSTKYGANCSDMFESCELAHRSFDCCHYFLPILTPVGHCFMFNSLQNNKPGSHAWLKTSLEMSAADATMRIVSKRPMLVSILNAEDIPHTALPGVALPIVAPGQHKTFQLAMEYMTNDADVREVLPEFRKCRFPDELQPGSAYRSHSFGTCLADCERRYQLAVCNCTPYQMNPYARPLGQDCDLRGYYCLEEHSMLKPDAKVLLHAAASNVISCDCLPSCEENDIRLIYESLSDFDRSVQTRSVTLTLPAAPTERYRRQALRTRLDIVVTIGGILGLFLGASILSGIEFVYYFTVRLCNCLCQDSDNATRRRFRTTL